jgi:universal stress protein A
MIRLSRILLPTDFSQYSSEATKYACAFAEKFDAELHLLHVLETHLSSTPEFAGGLALPTPIKENREKCEKALLGTLDSAWAQSRRSKIVRSVADGVPFLEIVRYARERSIDLIVLGTHGRSGLAHVLMGSVAGRVVRKAPVCDALSPLSLPSHFGSPSSASDCADVVSKANVVPSRLSLENSHAFRSLRLPAHPLALPCPGRRR